MFPSSQAIPRKRLSTAVLVLIALTAIIWGGVFLWEKVIRDRVIAKKWGVVIPGKVFRSGQLSSALIEPMLETHGIRAIVNLQSSDPNDFNQVFEHQVAQTHGIEEFRCQLGGNGTGRLGHYADAISVLHSCRLQSKPVLVHCAAGAQRTGGVVAAYRLLVEQQPPASAYAEMKRYGWNPNRDQILVTYLNSNMAELAQMLVERRVIDKVPEPLPIIGP